MAGFLPGNDDTRRYGKVTKALLPQVGQAGMGGGDIGEEELLLPLGVPSNANKRRLLQLAPKLGPRLPPDEELRRLRLRSDAGMPANNRTFSSSITEYNRVGAGTAWW